MSEPPEPARAPSADDHSDVRIAEKPAVATPDSLLSFKVYTLAELERRSDAPISMRASHASFETTGSGNKLQWRPSYEALKAFVIAARDWYKSNKLERPNIKVALRKPFDQLGDALQLVVEAVDWKRLGVNTGIVVGATLTLLFAVLTAAELTDDLKPAGSAAHLASTETSNIPAKNAVGAQSVAPATNMAATGVQPTAVPSAPAPAVTAPAVTAMGDIDDDTQTAPETPAAKKKPAKKAAAAPKPAKGKLTFRNADAVFKQ
jgi:hypothetical protein